MTSILSDKQLEALVCSKCSKYLSIFPIKNYDNREVKCGRCNEEGDGGTKSLYELVVNKCLFKCVNRFEGCSKLLLPEHVVDHEKECIGGTVICPKCNDANERSFLDLIRHYKHQHPTSYLRKNSYEGFLINEDILLYIQDDVVFFISLQCSPDTLYISAATLTKEDIEQEFIVMAGSTVKITKMRLCKSQSQGKHYCDISIGPMTDPIRIIFYLEVSKKWKNHQIDLNTFNKTPLEKMILDTQVTHNANQNQSTSTGQKDLKVTLIDDSFSLFKLSSCQTELVGVNGIRINLVCFNCKHFMGQFAYKCEFGVHFLCKDCSNWCHTCNCLTKKIEYDLQRFVKIPCRWNCGQYSEFDHEYLCEFNVKICPFCATLIKVRFMPNHFMTEHRRKFSYTLNLADYLDKNHHTKKGERLFLLCHKLFNLQWHQKPNFPILYKLNFIHLENLGNGRLAITRTMKNGEIKYKATEHIHVLVREKPMLHLEISSSY